MRSAPVPNLLGGSFGHGGLHCAHGLLADQRPNAQYHSGQPVLASLAGYVLELADDRFQDFARSEQPFVTACLSRLFLNKLQQLLAQEASQLRVPVR